MSSSVIAKERRGLYYPWVHFRDDEWVKKALLVFPGLFRMVAEHQVPDDSLLIYDLRARGLIHHADLWTSNARSAQDRLEVLIKEDLDANREEFVHKFGRLAAQTSGQPSFQMHLGKASYDFARFLQHQGLAWKPDRSEGTDYSELHPSLGQAVMGTIAMACAEDSGLHIVGVDSPRGKDVSALLNGTLNAKDRDGPYESFVRMNLRPASVQPSADELFHVVVNLNCDVSHLDADALVQLQAEREPLRVLKQRVQELAATLPDMKNSRAREEAFRDKANDIVKYWEKDRANFSKYAREVFAADAFGSGAGKFLQVMSEKLIPMGIGTYGASQVFNATAGLGVGLLTHVLVSCAKVRASSDSSPWRYMTLAQGAGAKFSVTTSGEPPRD